MINFARDAYFGGGRQVVSDAKWCRPTLTLNQIRYLFNLIPLIRSLEVKILLVCSADHPIAKLRRSANFGLDSRVRRCGKEETAQLWLPSFWLTTLALWQSDFGRTSRSANYHRSSLHYLRCPRHR